MRRKTNMTPFRLSKSKMLSGFQCPKRLYLEIHQPNLADDSKSTERIFTAGNLVGEIARQAHPEGKLIGHVTDLKAALAETAEELGGKGSTTLFEPAFHHGGALVRADVFSRKGAKHHLVEVKSTASVKNYHLNDAAIQSWVIAGRGVSTRYCFDRSYRHLVRISGQRRLSRLVQARRRYRGDRRVRCAGAGMDTAVS